MGGMVQGAYAQYALATCSLTTLKPFSLSLVEAGTIPIVGGTSLQCLQEAGAPWTSKPTVVVTAGQGGTGFIGIQLAKALGAGTVITYILLPGGDGGVLSNQTKSGVSQISFGRTQPAAEDLVTIARLVDRWEVRPSVLQSFYLDQVPQAFTRSLAGGV